MRRPVLSIPLVLGVLLARTAQAAVGCTLSNPAQDLLYLFPEMMSYKEEAWDLSRMKDGTDLYRKLRDRLGSDLDPVYEAIDTPYTAYRVFQGERCVGIVHGVNVPGKGGVIQVFLAVDPDDGRILQLFFQRIESPAAKALKDKAFRARFAGLTLADFYKHDYYAAAEPGSEKDRVGRIEDPTKGGNGTEDFRASLRGIRKNLILLDVFFYGMRNDPFYERAQESLKALKDAKGATP